MRRAISTGTKRGVPARDVNGYLAGLPMEARVALEKIRKIIKSAIPDATEGISYGIPVFKHKGRPLVWIAAWKNHCSFYPLSPNVLRANAAELEGYDVAKGTIRFPANRPLSAALVKKLVEARIAENQARTGTKYSTS